jgi:hypothetical protein
MTPLIPSQSMASIQALVPYLVAVIKLARSQHAVAPVSNALLALVLDLNKPSTSRRVLKPYSLALALYVCNPIHAPGRF